MIKGLAWIETLTKTVSTPTTDTSSFGQSNTAENHWLLENINSSNNSEKRLLYYLTFLLHETRMIQASRNGNQLEKYDQALITENECPRSLNNKNQLKCYTVRSLMPRNLILRERVLTADVDLKPELADSLQAEDGDVKAGELNKVSDLDLQYRNFDYADFTGSSLPKADLRRTSLKHTSLINLRIDDAKLQFSYLDGANLADAQLPNAKLGSAQLSDANLSSAQLSGADLGGTQLSGANLARNGLSGVNFSWAQLSDADLSSAQLSGANLRGAKLSGAILNNIVYQGLSDEKSIEDSLNTFRKQLAADPNYQTEQGKQALEDKVTDLKLRLLQPTDFSQIVTEVPCVSDNEDLTTSGACIAWDKTDELQKDKIFESWKNLACQDNSVKHWAAKEIVERVLPEYVIVTQWPGLAVKLNQALQDAKHCQGLAGLSDDLKKTAPGGFKAGK